MTTAEYYGFNVLLCQIPESNYFIGGKLFTEVNVGSSFLPDWKQYLFRQKKEDIWYIR